MTETHASGIMEPIAGAIASKINRLVHDTVQEISRADKVTIAEILSMLDKDPVASACSELKALRATVAIGEYENKNKEHQEWVKKLFQTMDGSLSTVIGQMTSAAAVGFAIAEIVLSNKMPGFRNQWRLAGFNILDPAKVSFAGCKGRITHVLYLDGGITKWIPYKKCIHITNGFITTFNDPFGKAEAKLALPYYKSKQVVLAEMTVAAKNNATGVWYGKANSADTVEILGPDKRPLKGLDGKPIRRSAVETLAYQLQNLENGNVIVTDEKNSVQSLQMNAGEQFWSLSLNLLNDAIMIAFGVPRLIFQEGSSSLMGNGLSATHRTTLDSQIESIVLAIREELLEKVVRPLLVFNFGEQQDFGDFSAQVTSDPQTKSGRVGQIIQAINSGIFSTQDLDVLNKLRSDLDLPETTREDMEETQEQEIVKQMRSADALAAQQAQQAQNAPATNEMGTEGNKQFNYQS